MKRKNNTGITLIALVITIIVLLILAGITISLTIGEHGILNIAKEAGKNYQNAAKEESEELADLNNEIKNAIGSTSQMPPSNTPEIQIGDYVNYQFTTLTQEQVNELNSLINTNSGQSDSGTSNYITSLQQDTNLKWRVLEKDSNGNITKLISESETGSLGLWGANGYNNSVYLLDKACETLYSGQYGTAKNIKIEDVEECYSESGKNIRDSYTADGLKYQETKRYTKYAKYPMLACQEKGMGINTTPLENGKNPLNVEGLKRSEQTQLCTTGKVTTNPANGITITQNAYVITELSNLYKEDIYYQLFHEMTNTYWLSSRACRNIYDSTNKLEYPSFSVFSIDYDVGGIYSLWGMYRGTNGENGSNFALRPIITLHAGVQANYERTIDSYNVWNLSKI